ncbi:MAG: phosphoribosyltransferase [bacterium]
MNLSWLDVFDGAQQTCQRRREIDPGVRLPCYVAIGRGGLVFTSFLARFQHMETILYLPIRHYGGSDDLVKTREYRRQWVGPLTAASVVYLVDDIYDTGMTLEYVASEFLNSGAATKIVALTLLVRGGNQFKQGGHIYYKAIQTKEWVIFPWEAHDPDLLKEVPF